ncbi:MAG: hypothetical protein AAGG01_04430, partial [Planctomycetota bacterium]
TSGGVAAMATAGTTSVAANDLVLFCTSLPSETFGVFFYGQTPAQAPVGDGNICINNPFFRIAAVQATLFGEAFLPLDLTNLQDPAGQIMAGETWNFSFWFRQMSPAGFNFSNALAIQFCE